MTVASFFQHVPAWIFAVFVALLVIGLKQTFPRSVTLRRSIVLPALLMGLSLMGVASAFGAQPQALLAWALGLAAAVALLHGRVDTSAVRFSATTRRFEMPGSGWPLALMMSLFALKFAMGATLALRPELRQSVLLATSASAAYGLFSGLFLGRAMALWALAREALSGDMGLARVG
jgi:hypothetical protein